MTENSRVRFGIVSGTREPFPELVRRWQEAESLGFDTVWVTDHFITGSEPGQDLEPILEAWTSIAALAMATTTIRFGVMVTGNTYRNPALLAKQAVTIDHISDGRLILGFGAGWWEREHAAYGYDFPSNRELVDRFGEALEIMTRLQEDERATVRGQYYWVDDAPFEPKPIQRPHVPLLVGASGPRMLRLTAKYADEWNTRGPVDEVAPRIQALNDACREIGRDPNEIVRSIWPYGDPWTSVDDVQVMVADYRRLGFDEVVFAWPGKDNVDVMRTFAQDVMSDLR
ncbi:MAG TPA: TIGR03560 family F420-dependent LLM class oxidoreductase [Thermomicrobiales bacterium]|nr:TIGR03560 family F420-dependent LLM class oxidoreductase [Thermomicrobiales bacterium]